MDNKQPYMPDLSVLTDKQRAQWDEKQAVLRKRGLTYRGHIEDQHGKVLPMYYYRKPSRNKYDPMKEDN